MAPRQREERAHVRELPIEVHWQQEPRTRADRRLHRLGIEIVIRRGDVDRDRDASDL